LYSAQRVLPISLRFIEEAVRDILGHERHLISNLNSGDYVTAASIAGASTID
jgi:hypothetical protein